MTEKPKWPTMTVSCPDNITGDLLRYWDYIWTPQKGEWVHPDDKKRHKKLRAAVKVLLPYVE